MQNNTFTEQQPSCPPQSTAPCEDGRDTVPRGGSPRGAALATPATFTRGRPSHHSTRAVSSGVQRQGTQHEPALPAGVHGAGSVEEVVHAGVVGHGAGVERALLRLHLARLSLRHHATHRPLRPLQHLRPETLPMRMTHASADSRPAFVSAPRYRLNTLGTNKNRPVEKGRGKSYELEIRFRTKSYTVQGVPWTIRSHLPFPNQSPAYAMQRQFLSEA